MSSSQEELPTADKVHGVGSLRRRRNGRLTVLVALAAAALVTGAALQLVRERAHVTSLALAEKARDANDRGEHAKALLWALTGLPRKGELFGPQSAEARAELLRAWGNNRLLYELGEESGWILSVSFSPDSRTLLATSHDGTAQLRDVQTGQVLKTLRHDGVPIKHAKFHPDGERVLTALGDGTVQLRDLENGSIRILLKGDTAPGDFVGFSPDGARIVALYEDGTAKLRDVAPDAVVHTLKGPADEKGRTAFFSRVAAFSPDGKRLLTASDDGSVQIWNAATGEFRHTLTGGKESRFYSDPVVGQAVFSPSGRQVAAAYWDGTAAIWDSETGRQICTLEGHADRARDAAFSPTGDLLVIIADDHLVHLWNPETCRPVRTLAPRPTYAPVKNNSYSRPFSRPRVAFSADGARLVTTTGKRSAQLWDVKTGDRLESFGIHTYPVDEAAFSPDDAYLVTATLRGRARVWSLRPTALVGVLNGHDEIRHEKHLAFDPAGRHLATVSRDGTVRLRDGLTGESRYLLQHEGTVGHLAFDGAGKRLITASGDRTARVWDVATGRLLTTLREEKYGVERAILDEAGRYALSLTYRNSISLWDVETGRRLNTFQAGDADAAPSVLDMAFTPGGPRVLAWKRPKAAAILWNAETGEPNLIDTKPDGMLVNGRFSRQGTHLITTIFTRPGPGTARIWKAESGAPVMKLEADWQFTRFLEFDWTRRRLIAAHATEAWIWDLASGRRRQALSGELGSVMHAAHPGGRPDLAFTASDGGGALLWDVPTARPLREFADRTIRIRHAAINPQGTRIATASEDNRIRLWKVAPIYRAALGEQVAAACAMATRTGVDHFSDEEMLEPLLRGRGGTPCQGREKGADKP